MSCYLRFQSLETRACFQALADSSQPFLRDTSEWGAEVRSTDMWNLANKGTNTCSSFQSCIAWNQGLHCARYHPSRSVIEQFNPLIVCRECSSIRVTSQSFWAPWGCDKNLHSASRAGNGMEMICWTCLSSIFLFVLILVW